MVWCFPYLEILQIELEGQACGRDIAVYAGCSMGCLHASPKATLSKLWDLWLPEEQEPMTSLLLLRHLKSGKLAIPPQLTSVSPLQSTTCWTGCILSRVRSSTGVEIRGMGTPSIPGKWCRCRAFVDLQKKEKHSVLPRHSVSAWSGDPGFLDEGN